MKLGSVEYVFGWRRFWTIITNGVPLLSYETGPIMTISFCFLDNL